MDYEFLFMFLFLYICVLIGSRTALCIVIICGLLMIGTGIYSIYNQPPPLPIKNETVGYYFPCSIIEATGNDCDAKLSVEVEHSYRVLQKGKKEINGVGYISF